MKAIINVHKNSSFAKFNGLTFEVTELLSGMLSLNLSEYGYTNKVDFVFSEVLIVDIQSEAQKAFDNYNWGSDNSTYTKLRAYCQVNNINIKVCTNCPA